MQAKQLLIDIYKADQTESQRQYSSVIQALCTKTKQERHVLHYTQKVTGYYQESYRLVN